MTSPSDVLGLADSIEYSNSLIAYRESKMTPDLHADGNHHQTSLAIE